ncbi:MarR family transcriptional regulator, partial [Sulfolobus sp. E5]
LHCCTLAARESLDYEKIKRIYEDSFSWFKSSPDRWAQDYAALINIDYPILLSSLKNYEFDYYLDIKEFKNNLRNSGIFIPF